MMMYTQISRNTLWIVLFCFSFNLAFSQHQHKISTYFSAQYTQTVHDITLGNNPWGIGVGLQTFLNNTTRFKPTIDLTADAYLEDDKILRTINGKEIEDVGGVINVFVGSAFQATQNIYVSFVAGPSFINSSTLFGIKPSVSFYFSKKQKTVGKVAYINIFNRNKATKEDFSSMSFTLGFKLF